MNKLIASVATFTLAGSAVAVAATTPATTPAIKAPPPPIVLHQMQPAYHEANTTSPVTVGPKQKMQATNQTTQNPPQTGVKTASVQMATPATATPNYGPSTLMSRLNAVSTRIHLAQTTGKLTGPEYRQLRADYSLVAGNIERAHDRFGREIPSAHLWELNGQIRYLSNQVSKLIG